MKVKDLKVGMLIKPVGDSEIFYLIPPHAGSQNWNIPFVTVRTKSYYIRKDVKLYDTCIYVGTRKDVLVSKKDLSYTDKYVMINGMIAGVDPSAWARIEPVQF